MKKLRMLALQACVLSLGIAAVSLSSVVAKEEETRNSMTSCQPQTPSCPEVPNSCTPPQPESCQEPEPNPCPAPVVDPCAPPPACPALHPNIYYTQA